MTYAIGQILEYKADGGRVKVLEVGANTAVLSLSESTDQVLGIYGFSEIERDYKVIE